VTPVEGLPMADLPTDEVYYQFAIALRDESCLQSIIISLPSIYVARVLKAKSPLTAASSVRVLSHATRYVFDCTHLSEINVDDTKEWLTPPRRRPRNFLTIDVNHDYQMNNR